MSAGEWNAGITPTPRAPIRRSGDVLYRLRQRAGETAHDAKERAETLAWWPKVRAREPVWSAGWWCWSGKP